MDAGFVGPIQVLREPTSGYVYVVELPGTIRRFREGESMPTPELVLDITSSVIFGGEDGLLGMAFEHLPAQPGDVMSAIVKYIAPPPEGSTAYARTVVARVTSSDGGRTFDPSALHEIIGVDQPVKNHRGGRPAFGSDGMLYIPTGDGGFETKWSAQDPTSLLGKILRIDTRSGSFPYAIPKDNPFVDTAGARPEIFALGFRNPYGWTFDPDAETPTLWVGDVGESRREEIDRVVKGANFGWPKFEGNICTGEPCDAPGLTPPVYTYENNGANAIIGGPVYRGSRFPELRGRVIIGDNATGRMEAISREPGNPDPILLDETGYYVVGLDEDAAGEIVIMEGTGKIQTLVRRENQASLPSRLSETGCVDMAHPQSAAPGLLPYDVNMPLWSDGTDKARFLSLPEGSTLHQLEDASFEVPFGTVAVKTFFWHDKPIETRLLVRQTDGDFAGYSYEWRDDGTDADLLEHGSRKDLGDLTWIYPSRSQCLACHTAVAGRTLGLDVAQLNREVVVDGVALDQLATWQRLGLLAEPLGETATLPRFPKREDPSSAAWARAYLQTNCSHCHRPGGIGAGSAKLLASAPVAESGCDELPLGDTFGIDQARFIAPGRPEASLAIVRMTSPIPGMRMPSLGTSVPDDLAISAVSDWIRSLESCDAP